MGRKAFVICGTNNIKGCLNSIEKFDFASSKGYWQTIQIGNNDVLTPRYDTGVAQLNDTEFVILGGADTGDIFTFDVETSELVR